MITPKRNTDWLDFHPGGVPAGIIFDGQIEDVLEIMKSLPNFVGNTAEELALIGLVAFFEGFCKNHTAAILNICPQLVSELNKNGREIKLSPLDVVNHAENLPTQLGSLVVEKIDLGTAKSINSLYTDLLRITPLSKREADKFHTLIDDRNLIVHHGNVFTPRYPAGKFVKKEIGGSRIFLDSLVIARTDIKNAAHFLHQISIKLREITKSALEKYVAEKQLRLGKVNRQAIANLHFVQPFQN